MAADFHSTLTSPTNKETNPLKNRIYLVRHGENRANLTKEFSYRKVDYSLTEKGRLQAQQTADFFRDKEIHEIYSSPLKRAVETAEFIAEPLGLPVTVMESMREVNVGRLEDYPPSAELWKQHDAIIADWLDGHPDTCFPGGENYFGLLDRFRATLEAVTADKEGQNLMLVAHGGVITFTMPDVCEGIDKAWLRGAYNANCSITELMVEQAGGRLRAELVRWASTAHLYGEAAKLIPGVPERDTFK